MEELIQRLDTWLHTNRPTYYAQLNPGTTDTEIAAFEQRLGLTLPDDVKTFYRWRNGEKEDKSDWFFSGFMWRSLESSSARWFVWKHEGERYDYGANWWNPAWVPFLGDNTGDDFCIDVGGWYTGNKNQIIDFIPNDTSFITNASFYTWLETHVIAFERSLFRWDGEDSGPNTRPIPDDAGRYYEWEKENNLGYPLWPDRAVSTDDK